MSRHEALPAQIATPSSRSAQDLAPVDGEIGITPTLGHICRGKVQLNGLYFALRS